MCMSLSRIIYPSQGAFSQLVIVFQGTENCPRRPPARQFLRGGKDFSLASSSSSCPNNSFLTDFICSTDGTTQYSRTGTTRMKKQPVLQYQQIYSTTRSTVLASIYSTIDSQLRSTVLERRQVEVAGRRLDVVSLPEPSKPVLTGAEVSLRSAKPQEPPKITDTSAEIGLENWLEII